jgi:hypothetical protein
MKKSKTDEGERVYKSTCRLIQRWAKEANELRKKYRTHPNSRKVKVNNKGLLGLDAEKELIDWYQGIRDLGGSVNGVYLQMRAREVANDYGLESFKASTQWLKRFLKRHRLSFRTKTRVGQMAPVDADAKRIEFIATVKAKMEELGGNAFL